MASLVHDDLIDGAELRRGRASVWSAYGPEAASGGRRLPLRARVRRARRRPATPQGSRVLADSALALVRGEALERASGAVPTRPSRSTWSAARSRPRSSSRPPACSGADACELGAFGLALGIAFQIIDDCLDCAGQTVETGKIAGTDLREGIPTLPLLLAAREDEVVRRALAGGSLDGALLRVAASGAIEEAREVAREYAEQARACLEGVEARARSSTRSPTPS